jgi:hypothetical protein
MLLTASGAVEQMRLQPGDLVFRELAVQIEVHRLPDIAAAHH